jgi:hypothetical protein
MQRRPLWQDRAAAALCVWFALTLQAHAADKQEHYRTALKEGQRLLDEGKWEEALSAYGRWGDRMGEELRRRIAAAEQGGETAALHRLYQAYFHYYPFGYVYWHHDWRKWGQAACGYAELLRNAREPDADPTVAQTVAALPIYGKLMAAHARNDEEKIRLLVDQIVRKHPGSLFAPSAVLTLANVVSQKRGNGAEGLAAIATPCGRPAAVGSEPATRR